MCFLFNSFTFHIDYVLGSGASLDEEPQPGPKPAEDEDDESRPLVITFEADTEDSA